jgi:hypothetical protein
MLFDPTHDDDDDDDDDVVVVVVVIWWLTGYLWENYFNLKVRCLDPET